MRLVIQRAISGEVTVKGETVGKIGKGLVILVGFSKDEDGSKIKTAAQKALKLRLWNTIEDDNNPDQKIKTWDTNVMQNGYELLVVSQFTLYCVLKGNKPDFHQAKRAEEAKLMYEEFVEILKKEYDPSKIQTGAFGQYMNVNLVNDGPVTVNVEY